MLFPPTLPWLYITVIRMNTDYGVQNQKTLAGVKKIRIHDFRHTCASLLLNKGKTNGVTLKDIQVWLGHSDFSTTANTYSHLDANSKFSSLNTLAGVVNL